MNFFLEHSVVMSCNNDLRHIITVSFPGHSETCRNILEIFCTEEKFEM